MSNERKFSRRGLFTKVGILFNGVVAANLWSRAALTSTIQITRSGESQDNRPLQRVEWFAGVQFNGRAGAMNGIAAPILALLAYLAWSSRSS